MIEHVFVTRHAASAAVAVRIEAALRKQLAEQAEAAFVVSGGSSPAGAYSVLSGADLDWRRVKVLPSDERWVPPAHEDSNEKMLREQLLRARAAPLRLLPFYAADETVESRCADMEDMLRALPLPFACALLGMGEDGHFASLFPGIDRLGDGLDPKSERLCMPARMHGNGPDRITLTLAALAMSEQILLLAFGAEKRAVMQRAAGGDTGLPLSQLLAQRIVPVHAFWAA